MHTNSHEWAWWDWMQREGPPMDADDWIGTGRYCEEGETFRDKRKGGRNYLLGLMGRGFAVRGGMLVEIDGSRR